MIVVDGYAGIGVGQAVRRLGHTDWGIENAPSALAVREANGLKTIFEDIWESHELEPYVTGLDEWTAWFSPPCQLWSTAGNGAARVHREAIVAGMHRGVYEDVDELREFGRALGDENFVHVLVPLHYVHRYRPTFLALEQVPPVLSLWKEMVPVLEGMGYSAEAFNLQAEQFGVPQTRKRAFLMARRDGVEVQPPTPTHSRYYPRTPGKLDSGVEPWVSIAETLDHGWQWLKLHKQPNAAIRGTRYPAQTVAFGNDSASAKWFDTHDDAVAYRTWLTNGENNMRVTIEEAAALQSFDPYLNWDVQLPNGRPLSKSAKFQVIGNAVPVLLVERVLEALWAKTRVVDNAPVQVYAEDTLNKGGAK